LNSTLTFLIVAAAVIAILSLRKSKLKNGLDDGQWPFEVKAPLSKAEQILYLRLVQALPQQIILAQVQLSRLLLVKKGYNSQSWLNRINRMSVDFVVCDKDSSVICAIELDDATHQRKDRQAADAKKDIALSSAGVPIVRWQAKSLPNIATIQAALPPRGAAKGRLPAAAQPTA